MISATGTFLRQSKERIADAWRGAENPPIDCYQSERFLATIYEEPMGHLRLTVNKVVMGEDGRWKDGITWDELQEIKSKIGYGDRWAVEVYPADDELVNVANMRHLWILPKAPPYAWRPGLPGSKPKMIAVGGAE